MEGEIGRGVVRLGIVPEARAARLAVASRTDRGVSARGNALALSSNLPPVALLRALNGISPEIRFTHLVPVPEGFRPRSALERWYRYWDREATEVAEAWRSGAGAFVGRVDVRSFGRGLSDQAPVWRTISAMEPRIDSGWLVLDIRAPSFVWGMIRKIVSALRDLESGELPLARLQEAIRGERRLTLPMAEPERLVLWETRYPIPWEVERSALTGRQVRRFRESYALAASRREIVRALWAGGSRDRGP